MYLVFSREHQLTDILERMTNSVSQKSCIIDIKKIIVTKKHLTSIIDTHHYC